MIGDLNMRFEATYGDAAVRWALVWLTLAFVLTAGASVAAARSFRQDLARTRSSVSS